MNNIKGTKTEKNLAASFAGESQARNRYTYFASQAKKEGYEQIAEIFLQTADNEKEHAKRFFSFLQGGMVEISAAYPAGIIGNTAENLKAAAAGENEEHSKLYPSFADMAEQEGFKDIAAIWRLIAKIESHHEERYLQLLKNMQEEMVFKKKEKTKWKCRNCGLVHESTSAPGVCPVCNHSQSFFEVLSEKF